MPRGKEERGAMLALLFPQIIHDTLNKKGPIVRCLTVSEAWERKLNISAQGEGECDWARAECRVAGGKRQSKFLMLRMFPFCVYETWLPGLQR